MSLEWKTSACILCSINCGLTLGLQGRRIRRVRGDRAHPTSRGYLCEKPQSLDHYQSGRDRITAPMRRRADGTYEAVGWDAAIAEVAARLARVRDAHGGASIFYYGGGGQGNHLQGAYGRATRAALGSVYTSNALAQEKTGEFWVDGRLFGRARCHTAPDFERAEVAMFVGKNPWQSHGFPRARKVIQDIARDPERCLIVIDPRVSETAARADIHLRVRPGGDAYLLAALLKALFEGDHVDRGFVDARCAKGEGLLESLARVEVATWSARAGVHEALVESFLEYYEAHIAVHSRPFPGVVETLTSLRDAGHRMAVCTNKMQHFADKVLNALELGAFFETVVGGGATGFYKPDPEHLDAVLERLGLGPETAVMVGDSINDVAAAKALDMAAVVVTYGYSPEAVWGLGADSPLTG